MQKILDNPYRILGLLVGATAREQERQVRRLRQYIEAEQEPEKDFSFPVLGKFQRTLNDIEEATSKLNLDADKMTEALFWFYKSNDITDAPAFEALKEHDEQQAEHIWSKLTTKAEITERNASAFQNLSTLLLNTVISNNNLDVEKLSKAIELKLQFIESDFFNVYKNCFTDKTYKVSRKDAQLLFLNTLVDEITLYNEKLIPTVFGIINEIDFVAESIFRNNFIRKITDKIDSSIQKTQNSNTQTNRLMAGNNLYIEAHENLMLLKSIVGFNNQTYINISDKVANEILTCAIDEFNEGVDTAKKHTKIIKLCKKGQALALGEAAKQKYGRDMEVMQNPSTIEKMKVQDELNSIDALIQNVQHYTQIPDFIRNVKVYLIEIEKKLNKNNDYLDISSSIAQFAMNIVIQNLNIMAANWHSSYKRNAISAGEALKTIKALDMNATTQANYATTLIDIGKYVEQIKSGSKKNGCFTALWIIIIPICLYILFSDKLPNQLLLVVGFIFWIIHSLIESIWDN